MKNACERRTIRVNRAVPGIRQTTTAASTKPQVSDPDGFSAPTPSQTLAHPQRVTAQRAGRHDAGRHPETCVPSPSDTTQHPRVVVKPLPPNRFDLLNLPRVERDPADLEPARHRLVPRPWRVDRPGEGRLRGVRRAA
jgi:hypothetical protein